MTTIRRLIGGTGQRLARGKKRLAALKARAPIKPRATIGKPSGTATASGAGIASPLTEQTKTRKYFEAVRELTSSDGLFVLEYQNVLSITTKDAVGREVKLIFDDPDSW